MARLICLSGPRRGESVPLEGARATIGRSSANTVQAASEVVSRRHCEIVRRDGRFQLRDLDSRNGTFVNDLPVTERYLRDGDRVAVGDSVYVFADDEGEARPPSGEVGGPTGFFEPAAVADSAILAKAVEARLWKVGGAASPLTAETVQLPERDEQMAPEADRRSRDFGALLEIAAAVGAGGWSNALRANLLDLLLRVSRAERAAVLMVDPGTLEISEIVGKSLGPARSGESPLHGGVIFRALRRAVALYVNDMEPAGEITARAALAAPLAAGKVRGALYLDHAKPAFRFDEAHLQWMRAAADLCAGALDRREREARLERENQRLREEVEAGRGLVGDGPAMRRLNDFIERVSGSEATVLIQGESSTGKELVARAIHQRSPRAAKPFVAINCAALSDSLIEAELFGYEKGAFTGADRLKAGKIEAAEGGTLFLDEIGELPLGLQSKLLRVLQEREFERVGGVKPVQVDIRVLAATNRDLAGEVRQGRFREDLYYRLNVVSVRTPALRDRREDIPLLAIHFVKRFCAQTKKFALGLSPRARECLNRYDWPGNVRELSNAIEHAVVLSREDTIWPEDLPASVTEFGGARGDAATADVGDYHEALRRFKIDLVLRSIDEAGGVIAKAAENLGLHPNNLHRLIRNLDIKDRVAAGRR